MLMKILTHAGAVSEIVTAIKLASVCKPVVKPIDAKIIEVENSKENSDFPFTQTINTNLSKERLVGILNAYNHYREELGCEPITYKVAA